MTAPDFLPATATRMGSVVPFVIPDTVSGAAPAPLDRRVEVSFSSELPYLRVAPGGRFWEVLGHGDGEPDLTRLNSGSAPLLKDHRESIDAQIGVVERAWVDGGQARAVVRFSENPASLDVLARVRAGEVTGVSVGYTLIAAGRDGPTRDGHPVIRVTRWMPREISFVALPADPTVGYGRAETHPETPMIPVSRSTTEKEIPMPNDHPATLPAEAARAADAQAESTRAAAAAAVTDALTAERTRVSAIETIATRFDLAADMVRTARDNGTSADAFRVQVLDAISTPAAEAARTRDSMIGLSHREARSFSILNVARFLADPSAENRERAAFEIDASRAAATKLRREPGGLFVPPDVLMAQDFSRALNTGVPAAGGNLVATNLMAGSFIDLLRNRLALTSAGVRMMGGLVGDVDIPKQLTGSTAYWIGEGADVTDSEPTFGLVSMSPKTVAIATPMTRRQLRQSSPDIEAIVRADLIANAALAIDKAVLSGATVPNAPVSLRSQIQANALIWGASLPSYAEIIALESAIGAANADAGTMTYIYNAQMSGHLKATPVFGPESGRPVEGDGGIVNGYSRIRSNQVANGEVYFGNWSDLLIGMWSGLDLRVDTSTLAKSDGLVLRAFQDLDMAARHLQSFKLGKPV